MGKDLWRKRSFLVVRVFCATSSTVGNSDMMELLCASSVGHVI